jgi:hypothetical protein
MKLGFICPNVPGHPKPMTALGRQIQARKHEVVFGYATALTLAEKGFHVFGSVRRIEDTDLLKAEIGSQFTPLLFDLRDIKAIGAAAHLVRSSLNDPWAMSAIPEFIYPDTTGERTPDLQDRLNFRRALGRLAVLGAEVYELLVEIRHVLKPRTLLDDPAIVRRVKEEIAEWRCLVAPLAT